MNNDIYEVTRDEYVGFIGEIKPDCQETEVFHLENCTIIKVLSKKNKTHFCTRIIPEEDNEHYYIFNMPDNNERQHGKPIRKVILETPEEVQTFFNVLSKAMKGDK